MDAESDVIKYYTYDESGNILNITTKSWNGDYNNPEIGSTVSSINYSYTDSEWKDLLTAYNGQTITYDTIGNPLTYRDGITLTWQNGRELASFSNSSYDITYSYDASGMRTGKAVTTSSGATTNYSYVYENGLLQKMTRGNRILDLSYDANGTPVSIKYRSSASATPVYYYYGLNSRGDVTSLYDSNGNLIVVYTYDAYGKLLSIQTKDGVDITSATNIANLNPLRYRGYVYDTETGFYYLQSRYYDPTTCRFINGDSQLNLDSTNGFNVFAYCNGNPAFYTDNCGTRPVVGASPSSESYVERKLSFAYMNNRQVYTSIDSAAKAAGILVATETSKDNKEHAIMTYYIGNIGDVKYYYNGPMVDGTHATVRIEFDLVGNEKPAAATHSHPYCNGHIPNDFSYEIYDPITNSYYGDAVVSKYYNIPFYLAAPNGTLRVIYWVNNDEYKVEDVCGGLPKDISLYYCK